LAASQTQLLQIVTQFDGINTAMRTCKDDERVEVRQAAGAGDQQLHVAHARLYCAECTVSHGKYAQRLRQGGQKGGKQQRRAAQKQ
jgi:hypothetical protein